MPGPIRGRRQIAITVGTLNGNHEGFDRRQAELEGGRFPNALISSVPQGATPFHSL
jgi:hypothetical protein